MTPDQTINFLKALGCKPHYDGGPWVKSDCPMAPFTHANFKDTNPSFGVSIDPGRVSQYNCFTCHSGNMEELVQKLEMYSQQNPSKAHRYDFKTARTLLEQEEVAVQDLGEYNEFGSASELVFQEWPDWFINSFASAAYSKPAMDYLTKRGVTFAQIEKHNLRYDSQKEMIVHPYKNVYGLLAGARGRSINDNVKGFKRHYDYTWNKVNNASLVWYGEEELNNEAPIVVVEGQFDKYRVERVYEHVIANLTGKPVPAKMKKLVHAPGVILMLDNDTTADVAIEKYKEYFNKYELPWVAIQPPKLLDAGGNLIKEDPDSMGEDWIREVLKPYLPV